MNMLSETILSLVALDNLIQLNESVYAGSSVNYLIIHCVQKLAHI